MEKSRELFDIIKKLGSVWIWMTVTRAPDGNLTTASCGAFRCAWKSGRRISNRARLFSSAGIPLRRSPCPWKGIADTIANLLDEIHANMLKMAREFRDAHTFKATNFEEFEKELSRAWLCEGYVVRLPGM